MQPTPEDKDHAGAPSALNVELGMEQQIYALIGDRLTALKATDICNRMNFKITGVVLRNENTNERCLVELSDVRWLHKDEMWKLMHPDA